MTVEFQVIGELKDDSGHFLLMGDDGQCYDYDLATNEITPVDVDGSWLVDVPVDKQMAIEAELERLAS